MGAAGGGGDDTTQSLQPRSAGRGLLDRNRLIPIVIASALFMELMDSNSLALAIPTIAVDLNATPTDMRLALTVYAATVASLVPVSSWMASRFGARRVFVGAIMLFMTGSVLSGIADSLAWLVSSRVVQGIGGSMMIPVGRSIMVGAVDRGAMVKAMTWFTLPAIMAPLLGPPLAGFLIEFVDWRWIFFINVPVGFLAMLAIIRFVPVLPRDPGRAFDFLGFGLCAATILSAMALLETGMLTGQSLPLRVLAGVGTILLGMAFVRYALRKRFSVIDLRVLRHPTLRISLAGTWLQRVSMGALVLVLPLQLQIGLGLSPLVAAQVPAAGAIGSIIARFTTPAMLRKFGFRNLMAIMAVIIAAFSCIPMFFRASTPIWLMAAFMIGYSLMRASYFMSGNSLSYADVEPGPEVGHASVLFSVAQQLSLGFGYTVGGSLLAAAGGAADPTSYWIVYPLIALVPLSACAVSLWLPRDAGELLRREASA